MTGDPFILQITTIEAAQLAAVVAQFAELVAEADRTDGAVARLVPDPYPDDPEAGREFSRLTRGELLDRRSDEAGIVLRTLGDDVPDVDALDDDRATEIRTVELSRDDAAAWMRTLAGVRLVLAARLGIQTEDDAVTADPRFLIYEWLGGILEGVVQALDREL